KPTDNQTLMTQMSTIRQMEMSSQLNKTLTTLSAEQRFGSASGLIGHYVTGSLTDSGGNPVTVQGVVTGVTFDKDGSAILELPNGALLPADKVSEVTVVQNLPHDVQEQLSAQTTTTKNKLGAATSGKSQVNLALGKHSALADTLNSIF